MNKDYSRSWRGLKKISKPAYSASTLHLVKFKSGQDLFDLLFNHILLAKHYILLHFLVQGKTILRMYNP
jgi:hypothetical protein